MKPRIPSYSTRRPPRLASNGVTSTISPPSNLAVTSSQPLSFTALRRLRSTYPSFISESMTEVVTLSPSLRLRAKETSLRGTRPTPWGPRSISISCFLMDKTVPSTVSPVVNLLAAPSLSLRSSSIVSFLAVAIVILFLPLDPLKNASIWHLWVSLKLLLL